MEGKEIGERVEVGGLGKGKKKRKKNALVYGDGAWVTVEPRPNVVGESKGAKDHA